MVLHPFSKSSVSMREMPVPLNAKVPGPVSAPAAPSASVLAPVLSPSSLTRTKAIPHAQSPALSSDPSPDPSQFADTYGRRARQAWRILSASSSMLKDQALWRSAGRLRRRVDQILDANLRDLAFAKEKGLSKPKLERLTLDEAGVEAMAGALEAIASLEDPVGKVTYRAQRPNGLRLERVAVPLGVIGIIYESRPNVTAEAAGLCLKSGNAVVLRCGSETLHSARAIADCIRRSLRDSNLPEDCVQLIASRDRAFVDAMLRAVGTLDVLVPRGGKSLVERVHREARVPLFAHLEGVVTVYIDREADLEKARDIVLNAKLRRTSICGAAENLLLDQSLPDRAKVRILNDLIASGCEVRVETPLLPIDSRLVHARPEDFTTEYLDKIISVGLVSGVEEAVERINRDGSHHTDAILTENPYTARRFLEHVDSAIVMHNCSTQFADGGEFGFGAEIGIATGRLHARGPVGVEQLTSYKYRVHGDGQCRPV